MTMVQIRHVPEELHRHLKARAALEGLSLSEYALRELTRAIERPSPQELLARIRSREPVRTTSSATDLVRAERDAR